MHDLSLILTLAVADGEGERAWLQEVGAAAVYDAFDEAASALVRAIEANL
jgi:hypothetical protein